MENSKKCHSESSKLPKSPKVSKKSKAKYINKCKTKNCLAFFKTAHLKFMKSEGVQRLDWPGLMDFCRKEGAAKENFVEMYQEKGLAKVLERMFKSKYLYRYLMTSRAFDKQKCIFQKEIGRM